MSSATVTQSLLERIAKILRKTEDAGCSAEEAANAYALASKLMVEHNLTMDDLGSSECRTEGFMEEIFGTVERWGTQQAYGSAIIKKFFFVETIIISRYRDDGRIVKDLHVFGQPSNVATARFIFTSLMRAFYTLWEDYRVKNNASRGDQKMFVIGVGSGFMAKLEEERRADEMERDLLSGSSGPGTGIILASIAEKTLAEFEKAHPKTTKTRHSMKTSGSRGALDAGYAEGRKLNFSRPLGGSGPRKLHG